MPYLTALERQAEERGEKRSERSQARESVLEILEARFGTVPRDSTICNCSGACCARPPRLTLPTSCAGSWRVRWWSSAVPA